MKMSFQLMFLSVYNGQFIFIYYWNLSCQHGQVTCPAYIKPQGVFLLLSLIIMVYYSFKCHLEGVLAANVRLGRLLKVWQKLEKLKDMTMLCK